MQTGTTGLLGPKRRLQLVDGATTPDALSEEPKRNDSATSKLPSVGINLGYRGQEQQVCCCSSESHGI